MYEHHRVMGITVRHATNLDSGNVLPVNLSARETLRKVYVRVSEVSQINSLPTTLLVALLDDSVVGRCEYSIRGAEIHFSSLGVLAEFRNRGVFTEIFKFLEATGRNFGCKRIVCETIEETGNESVFSRVGMMVLSRARSLKYVSPEGDLVHELVMGKKL